MSDMYDPDTFFSRMIPKEFVRRNICPGQREYNKPGQTAVNAVAIANGAAWEPTMRKLLEQAHLLHCLPGDQECIHAFLAAEGFIRQRLTRNRPKAKEVLAHLNEHCKDGQIAIGYLKGAFDKDSFCVFLPRERIGGTVPDATDSRYLISGLTYPLEAVVTHLWVRWADGEDHSPVKFRPGKKKVTESYAQPPDHEFFHYCQKNPERVTGDCVIRSMASIFDLTWDEALDEIAEASNFDCANVNLESVYKRLLERERYNCRPRASFIFGRNMSGKEFCRMLNTTMRNGEVIMAELGPQHVAAILPFRERDGMHYRIVDSWDSSDQYVGKYWVSPRVPKAWQRWAHRPEKFPKVG